MINFEAPGWQWEIPSPLWWSMVIMGGLVERTHNSRARSTVRAPKKCLDCRREIEFRSLRCPECFQRSRRKVVA